MKSSFPKMEFKVPWQADHEPDVTWNSHSNANPLLELCPSGSQR